MVFVRYTSKQWTGELKRDFYQVMRALAQCTPLLPLFISLFSLFFSFPLCPCFLRDQGFFCLHILFEQSREIMRYCSLLLMDSFACLLACFLVLKSSISILYMSSYIFPGFLYTTAVEFHSQTLGLTLWLSPM